MKEKTQMKKLMVAAAAAAMAAGVYAAGFQPIDCTPDVPEGDCPVMTFKLTASGKAVQDYKGEYKTVKTLKISKGALVMMPDETMAQDCDICCYATANIYATVKVGSATHYVAINDVAVTKWSIFGKELDKVANFLTEMKKGSTKTVESDLYLEADDVDVYFATDDDSIVSTVLFRAAAFGKMNAKNLKAGSVSNSYCVKPEQKECVLEFTPKSYSGWFAGNYDVCVNDDQLCFNCDCGQYDIFGGTWKATYQAKATTQAAIAKLAWGKNVKFDDDEE